MQHKKYILAIDQGTSSTKTILFDEEGKPFARGSEALKSDFLDRGFVEQDPEEIFKNVLDAIAKCLEDFKTKGGDLNEINSCGISNQRETFVVWDNEGKPLHNAVVWQCKRSVQICERLKAGGLEMEIKRKTGLLIDPYFSGTKLIWLNENIDLVHHAILDGKAYFGTIDTWLLYKFTNGKEYATDYTNASRTLFFNLQTLDWDKELLEKFGLHRINLPQIKPSSSFFGKTTLKGLFKDPISINALIGDSHAAAFGEGCFEPGSAKATLGTGCSILMNVGNKPASSNNGMISTICWSTEQEINYALEGVIVSCGATIEWLKNELALFTNSKETEGMANAVADNGGVYLIPAFSGLGSPYWQMERRASLSGMSFGTTKNHIVRAALESIAYQIMDVITAMEVDAALSLKELNADGGITSNRFVIQFIANLLNKNVATIGMPDVSALGAALLAGLKVGVYESMDALKKIKSDKNYYRPYGNNDAMKSYRGWQKEIQQHLLRLK
ncbi:MAG: glycerol kinase GlpK [Verrucomicrobia bacterium]|nr:glycerol kinase GlpK [Prolixibacteraceae bacterium]